MKADYIIKDSALAEEGERILEEMSITMPVLHLINLRFKTAKTFEGLKIVVGLHLTSETGAFVLALKNGGADVYLVSTNPKSTNDAVAAALAVNHGVHVYANSSDTDEQTSNYQHMALEECPDIVIDEADAILPKVYELFDEYGANLIGSTVHTTAGVNKITEFKRKDKLKNPVIAVNESLSKHMFDNRFGVGQTFMEACTIANRSIIGGKTVVVCGYGMCGSGAAEIARGMGARVIVTEIDPFKAMEANLKGFTVMPIRDAAKQGDIFATFTGSTHVIDYDSMLLMKNHALMMNCGSGITEVDVKTLEDKAVSKKRKNSFVEEYRLDNGRSIQVVCEGRVANIVVAGGNPSEIMDMSFGVHAMAVEYLAKHRGEMDNIIMKVPYETDEAIIKLKLMTYGISIDVQTEIQKNFSQIFVE